MSKKLIPLYIFVTVILFVARSVFFAASFGGIEHDSGWYLGVARNLAERGIYASYTNTIIEEGVSVYHSIHGRFSVQDSDGFTYFPAGVTVGPGYIVPEALFIKLFGAGYWQYRGWPLLAFTILLLLTFILIWRIGNILSLIMFQTWLWVIPQFTLTYSYEANSEHIALLYLLVSFILIYKASLQDNKNKTALLSGIFFAFAYLTKTLFLFSAVSFLLIFTLDVLKNRRQIREVLIKWLFFLSGFILPIFIYEVYRLVFLIKNFGLQGYKGVNDDIKLVIQNGGSGINNLNLKEINWEFVIKKYYIWKDVGIAEPIYAWLFFLASPMILFLKKEKKFKIFTLLFFSSAAIGFLWFLILSTYGWARHAWQALFLGMALISMFVGKLLIKEIGSFKKVLFLTGLILLIFNINYKNFDTKFFLDQSDVNKWHSIRYVRGLEGFPSTPILSLSDQQDLISFFKNNIQPEDKIYYVGWFLNAEVSPLVDKVFFTLDRYLKFDQTNTTGNHSYAIFGPYQQGQWSFMSIGYVSTKTSQLCKSVVFKNSSYVICELRKNLVYNNSAYE